MLLRAPGSPPFDMISIGAAARSRCNRFRKRSIHSHELVAFGSLQKGATHCKAFSMRHHLAIYSTRSNTPGRRTKHSKCRHNLMRLIYTERMHCSLHGQIPIIFACLSCATFFKLAQHLVLDKIPPSPPAARATSPSRKDHDLDRHPNTSHGSFSRRRANPSPSASSRSTHTTAASTACYLPVDAHS
jgi:hypothetical protein